MLQLIEKLRFYFLHILLQVFDGLLNGDLDPNPSFFQNATGCTNYYNYMVCQVRVAQVCSWGILEWVQFYW